MSWSASLSLRSDHGVTGQTFYIDQIFGNPRRAFKLGFAGMGRLKDPDA